MENTIWVNPKGTAFKVTGCLPPEEDHETVWVVKDLAEKYTYYLTETLLSQYLTKVS